MNVLLTCVGRRNYLVEYFKTALSGRGKVLAANTYLESAGMAVADKKFVVPPVTDESYVSEILDICVGNKVGLVIPLIDLDAVVLSKEKKQFEENGIIVMSPSYQNTKMCMDKWLTHQWANKIGLNTPKTYCDLSELYKELEDEKIQFPLVLKPRWGIGSIGIHYINNQNDLEEEYGQLEESLRDSYYSNFSDNVSQNPIIIQEEIKGIEYGLDVFNNFEGEFLVCFIKEKLDMRAGETDRAKIVKDKMLHGIGDRIGHFMQHSGNIDVDIVVRDGVAYLLEINPRFGGHYPFSHAAGADLPSALVNMVLGQAIDQDWLQVQENVLGMKGIRIVTMAGGDTWK